ncbi:hypothetical protein C8R44DRAFT_725783 [Mycena epipterygia]|nr:hypothetical protein C8R44DRAFT_725783 [Mycena epipterygia]
MATQPVAFVVLLQGLVPSTSKDTSFTSQQPVLPPSSKPLIDVSSHDLAPLVEIQRQHQTREERMGVRTYKASGTYKNHKTGVEKPLTDKQLLAQKMQAIVQRDQQLGTSTGLTQTACWRTDSGLATAPTPVPKTGNAANAEISVRGHAKEAMKQHCIIFGKVKCVSRVAEAGVGKTSPLKTRAYGFLMVGSEILLARVITMYSKNRGKAGVHTWVPNCNNLGSLSYMVVQLHQHLYRHQFKCTDCNYAALGTLQFAHLLANSFLSILPQEDVPEMVKEFRQHIEIGPCGQKIFDKLSMELEVLAKAVTSLNTVQWKGKANVNLLDLEEEEDIVE